MKMPQLIWRAHSPVCPALLALLAMVCVFAAACKEDPQKAKLKHVEKGKQYLKEKRHAEARIEFRNALLIDKNLADANFGLAEADLELGNLQEAFEAFRKTVELDDNNLEARIRLGNIVLQYARDDREAERLAGEVLQKNPNHIGARILRASVLVTRKQWNEAQAELENTIALDRNHTETYLSLARYYEQRGKAQENQVEAERFSAEAERVFRQAIETDRRASSARLAFGDFLYANKRQAEAEEQLRAAVEIAPDDKLALTALQRFYETQHRFDEAEKYVAKLAELDTDKNNGRAQLYDLHARAGRLDQAISEYEELVKQSPKYTRGYSRLAELLLARGDTAGASKHIDEALKLNKQDTDALLVRGRINTLNGRYRDAITDLEQVLKQEPTLPAALYYIADAHLQNNDPERARAFIKDMLRYNPQNPAGMLMLIRIHLHQGDAAEAVQTAEQIINGIAYLKQHQSALQASRLQPEMLPDLEAKGYTSRAVARIQLKDYKGAQADLERAAQIEPRSAEPHTNLATLFMLRNDLSSAQREAEKALELQPTNAQAVAAAVRVYLQQRNFDLAHAKLDGLLAAQPKSAMLLDQKALVFAAQDDAANTEKTLRSIIESDPNYLNAYFELSAFYVRRNQTDRGIAELQEIIKRKPDDLLQMGQAHVLLGMLEEARERYDEAVKNYEKSLVYDTRSASAAIAYNNLAWLYADRGKGNLDKAVDYGRNAITITPEAAFYDTLGYVYYKKQLHSKAAEQFGKAIEKRPLHAAYHLHLARALRENGQMPQARQAYERALQLGGANFPDAPQVRQELAALRRP
jgi:tetratricopeptide (TPR) repeat protein